jgi:hypothetical protein
MKMNLNCVVAAALLCFETAAGSLPIVDFQVRLYLMEWDEVADTSPLA